MSTAAYPKEKKFVQKELIRRKDGIAVYRVKDAEGQSRVLKTFENETSLREIRHYQLLKIYGVETIGWELDGENQLLLEDLRCSEFWRLGEACDLDSETIAEKLALWYKDLHNQGEKMIKELRQTWYSELDYFNLSSLKAIAERTQSQELPFWKKMREDFEALESKVEKLNKTITYNDFYFTNLAVARDFSKALMFDYNLMGRGFRMMDIRNVCSSLSQKAGAAFCEAYAYENPAEVLVDELIGPLINMAMAVSRPSLPQWFNEEWQKLESGYLVQVLARILEGE
ncbi:MAG: hypothetical protein VB108_08960 [Anaerolineaceae bacterium]|nr:hypothetical protein [Anaerolineaceae bacterium]